MIKLSELLTPRGFDARKRTKLVRHLDQRMDVKLLRRRGHFEFYQRTQSKDVFNCEQIVSFIGDPGGRAVFCGVYSVDGSRRVPNMRTLEAPAGYPYGDWLKGRGFLYDLTRMPGFEDLEDRLVVDWGKGALAWHQWYRDRKVLEVLPEGFVMAWPGYQQVLLSLADLRAIVGGEAGNREWQQRLSAVAGVYCILHSDTGDMYVGSAYGKDGIWGRWKTYAKTAHGHNQRLVQLCSKDRGYADGFVFSVLQVLPSSATKDEVVAVESLMKEKLGTRVFGANAN